MDEFSFIRSVQPTYYKQASLVKGISDDAAVFRPAGGDVVTAVDTMVEGIHFSKETMNPYHVGYRVLAANISDLAAMGSTPAYYLVSITVPSGWTQRELLELYSGMKELAGLYHMDLIGGDTVSGSELSVTVTVIGMVGKDKARYRSVAKSGDVLFVTGTLGDSRGGLERLLNHDVEDSTDSSFLIKRHRTPAPRVTFAEGLGSLTRVALNDISDGLANEANEIAEASNVDLYIDEDCLPYSDALLKLFPGQYKEWMLSGGEDFELLGTVSQRDWPSVMEAAKRANVSVTEIGNVTEKRSDTAKVFIIEDGQRKVLKKSGYTHLKEKGE